MTLVFFWMRSDLWMQSIHYSCYQWFTDPFELLGVAICAESRHQSSFGMSTVKHLVHLKSCQLCVCSLCASSAQSRPTPPLHRSEETQPHSALLSERDTVYHLKGSACGCDKDPRADEIKGFHRKKEVFCRRKERASHQARGKAGDHKRGSGPS